MYQTRLQSSGREPIFVSSLFRGGSISEPPFFCFAAGTQINLHSLCSSKKRFQSFVEAPGCSLLSRWDVAALVGLPCPLRYAPSPTPLRLRPAPPLRWLQRLAACPSSLRCGLSVLAASAIAQGAQGSGFATGARGFATGAGQSEYICKQHDYKCIQLFTGVINWCPEVKPPLSITGVFPQSGFG